LEGSKNNFGLELAIQNYFGIVVSIRWESDMTIPDKFSNQTFGVVEHAPGQFCSCFPDRLVEYACLHDSEQDAWDHIEQVREQDLEDNGQFGVGA
jgi:hypothetical protein